MASQQFPAGIAIVMPVYNEGQTIEATLAEFYEKILQRMPDIDLFVFEDGSRDDTKEKLQALSKKYDHLYISTNSERKGYPRAVRDALASIDESKYLHVLFTDSDGQYDPNDFFSLLDVMLKNSPDIVQGQRKSRAEPYYRVVLSSGMKVLERVLFAPQCKDITSAFRLMKTSVAKSIAKKVRYSGYNFWLEFTARASAEGYEVKEVPVDYQSREGRSNVYGLGRMPGIVWNEFGALVRTWWEYKVREAATFAIVGGTGAAVILLLSYVFTEFLGLNYLLSTGIAIEVSIIWAFILNDQITFRRKRKSYSLPKRIVFYNVISLGGLAINESILFLLVTFTGLYYIWSEIIAIAITFIFNYLLSVRWAWRARMT